MYWLILGIILIFVELATPGFVLMFFGMAALTVSFLTLLIPSLGQTIAWLLFAALSVVYLLLLRKFLKRVFMGEKDAPDRLEDSFIGKFAIVSEPIAPGKPGKVEFTGCEWEAVSDAEAAVGDRVKIIDKNNLTLIVKSDL